MKMIMVASYYIFPFKGQQVYLSKAQIVIRQEFFTDKLDKMASFIAVILALIYGEIHQRRFHL